MATVQGAAKPPCGTNERQVAKVAKGVMGNISASSRSLSEIGCMQRRKERREDAKAGQEKTLLLGGLGVLAFIFCDDSLLAADHLSPTERLRSLCIGCWHRLACNLQNKLQFPLNIWLVRSFSASGSLSGMWG